MGFKTKTTNVWDETKENIIGTRGSRLLTVKQLQRVIKRPIYCGVIIHKWTNDQPIRARYDGLVSIDKFNKANKGKIFIRENSDNTLGVLYNYSATKKEEKRNKNNPLFPCKNIVLCPFCKKPFLGSSPKGKSGARFPTYHCARNHKYYGINKKEFESNVESLIKNIGFTELFNNVFKESLANVYERKKERKKKEVTNFSSNVDQHISKLKTKKKQIIDSLIKVKSDIAIEGLEKEIESVEEEIIKSQDQKDKIGINKYDIGSFIKHSRYLMEHREKLLLNSTNVQKQQALFRLIFKEFPTYHNIVNGTPNLYPMFELSDDSKTQKSPMAWIVG